MMIKEINKDSINEMEKLLNFKIEILHCKCLLQYKVKMMKMYPTLALDPKDPSSTSNLLTQARCWGSIMASSYAMKT